MPFMQSVMLLQDVVCHERYTDGCTSQGCMSLTQDDYLTYIGTGYVS